MARHYSGNLAKISDFRTQNLFRTERQQCLLEVLSVFKRRQSSMLLEEFSERRLVGE